MIQAIQPSSDCTKEERSKRRKDYLKEIEQEENQGSFVSMLLFLVLPRFTSPLHSSITIIQSTL